MRHHHYTAFAIVAVFFFAEFFVGLQLMIFISPPRIFFFISFAIFLCHKSIEAIAMKVVKWKEMLIAKYKSLAIIVVCDIAHGRERESK